MDVAILVLDLLPLEVEPGRKVEAVIEEEEEKVVSFEVVVVVASLQFKFELEPELEVVVVSFLVKLFVEPTGESRHGAVKVLSPNNVSILIDLFIFLLPVWRKLRMEPNTLYNSYLVRNFPIILSACTKQQQ